MEEELDEDGYVTPTSQTTRVSLDRPPPPPRKRRIRSLRCEKNLANRNGKCWSKKDLLQAEKCGWTGKCSSCGEFGKLRPGRSVCFRLDCALEQTFPKLE